MLMAAPIGALDLLAALLPDDASSEAGDFDYSDRVGMPKSAEEMRGPRAIQCPGDCRYSTALRPLCLDTDGKRPDSRPQQPRRRRVPTSLNGAVMARLRRAWPLVQSDNSASREHARAGRGRRTVQRTAHGGGKVAVPAPVPFNSAELCTPRRCARPSPAGDFDSPLRSGAFKNQPAFSLSGLHV
jgi:hypothetical protein